ncbi:hypothetical protein ACGC1H_001068 [Rhizoctonia solani]
MVFLWASRWIETKRARSLLEGLEALLLHAQTLIDKSRGGLAPRAIKSFEADHAYLYRLVVTIRSDVDKRGKRYVFFVDESDRKDFYSNLKKLKATCEGYRDDVLSASDRAARVAAELTLSADSTSTVNLPEPEPNGSVFPIATPTVSSPARELPFPIPAPLSAVARLPREALPSLAGLPSGTTFLIAGTLDEHALSIAYDIRTHRTDSTDSTSAENEISRLSREGMSEYSEGSGSRVLTDNPLAFELAESFVSVISSSSSRNV